MKSRLMATTLALALFSAMGGTVQAAQNEMIVAQADSDVLAKFNQLVGDTRSASQLSDDELAARLASLRKLQVSKDLSKPQQQQLRKIFQDARAENVKRRQAKAQEQEQKKQQTDQSGDSGSANASGSTQDAENAQAQQKAASDALVADIQKFLADTANVSSIPPGDLQSALSRGRKLAQNPATPRNLFPKVRDRLRELRTAQQAANTAAGQQQDASGDQPSAQPKPVEDTTEAVQKFLADTQNLKGMQVTDLNAKLKQGRALMQSEGTPKSLIAKIRDRQRDIRDAIQAANSKPAQPADNGSASQQPQTQPPAAGTQPNADEVTKQAQAMLTDQRPATSLSQPELRDRVRGSRELLSGGTLAPNIAKQLRLKLARDRDEYRRRMAAENANDRPINDNADGSNNQKSKDKVVQLQPDDFYLKDNRRAVVLTTPELERRVLVRRIAMVDTRYPINQRNDWRAWIDLDRAELRHRALDDRRRREAEWLRRRNAGDLNIAINIDITPDEDHFGRPRPIYMAEADDQDIERYLSAAPVRKPARRYTIDEVKTMPDVRETMPAVEIDTINFGFNEDFVREEALDDLDRVGETIEKILTAHPGEIFLIEGHTDAVGSDEYNLDLSRRRAESVKQALTTYYSIDPKNLATVGYGERFPRIRTDEAEEENRRVTIRRATPLVGEVE